MYFFSENVAVTLYPVTVVARAYEYNVAIIFVVSIASVILFRIVLLDLLHTCVVFFVRFPHNHSVLLINPGVLCEEMDSCFGRKILEKGCVEMLIFLEYTCV